MTWNRAADVRRTVGRARRAPRRLSREVRLRTGRALGRASSTLLRSVTPEAVPTPRAREVAGVVFDVASDLALYTGLDPQRVNDLLRRRLDSFRVEWHLLPQELQSDHWYYLSSRMYLFANAVHDLPLDELEAIRTLAGDGVVLDFGGGSGNLALELAALGARVDFLELSAIQKDFVRFRAERYGLERPVRLLDAWRPLEAGRYAVVVAMDVLEHLPELEQALRSQIVPALAAGGSLVERSPFGAGFLNPMHHHDAGLGELLVSAGLSREQSIGGATVWRLGSAPA